MDITPNLELPYILASQAQKHVTHNEAIRKLDALVHLSVLDRNATAPPANPNDGDRYIVASGGTSAWSGFDAMIAAWQDGAWMFYAAQEGWVAWVASELSLLAFDGSNWSVVGGGGGGSVNPTPLVGINATADVNNRLLLSSPASLFNHDGNGHQIKVNKNTDTDTASLLFQTAFSGRAEMGLTGSDDFQFKVSPDGSTFVDAITIDKATGKVSLPNTSRILSMEFDTQYVISSTSYVDIGTDLIIPGVSVGEKLHISVSIFATHRDSHSGYIKLLANGANLFVSANITTREEAFLTVRAGSSNSSSIGLYAPMFTSYSGDITGSIPGDLTLKLQARTTHTSQALYVNRSGVSANDIYQHRAQSTITVIRE